MNTNDISVVCHRANVFICHIVLVVVYKMKQMLTLCSYVFKSRYSIMMHQLWDKWQSSVASFFTTISHCFWLCCYAVGWYTADCK